MYLVWKDKNKVKIKGVSRKRTASSKKNNQAINQIFYCAERTRARKIWFILNKNIKIPTIKITFKPVLA